MSCEKGKFPYCFLILLTQWHEFPSPELTNFHIFIIPFPLNVALFSKSPYLTVHIKINYETGCMGRFLKKHKNASRTIAAAKIELFETLASSVQLLVSFESRFSFYTMPFQVIGIEIKVWIGAVKQIFYLD